MSRSDEKAADHPKVITPDDVQEAEECRPGIFTATTVCKHDVTTEKATVQDDNVATTVLTASRLR